MNSVYLKLRRQIASWCEAQSPFAGEVEVDESYFGPRRVRGKRGRGASGKTIVFGIFQRDGFVYTQIVPDCRRKTLRQAILGRISLESIIHSDGWSGYDGLVDMGYQKHLRVNHDAHQFAVRKNHVNGIESFWSFAKRRLAKFNGIPLHTFFLHLKETEFRFNHRRANLSPRAPRPPSRGASKQPLNFLRALLNTNYCLRPSQRQHRHIRLAPRERAQRGRTSRNRRAKSLRTK